MHQFSGSLKHYLAIIVIEVAIVCGLKYGDVSPNHAYSSRILTSYELAYNSFLCKLSAQLLHPPSSSLKASSTTFSLIVIIACRLILYLHHAYNQPTLAGESRMGSSSFSTRLQHSSPSEEIDLRPLT